MSPAHCVRLLGAASMVCAAKAGCQAVAEPSAFTLVQPALPDHGTTKALRASNPAFSGPRQFLSPVKLGALRVQQLSKSARSISLRLIETGPPGTAVVEVSKALVSVAVPKELDDRPVLLRLTADGPAQVAVEVRTPKGALVDPIAGFPGRYMLDPALGGPFTIKPAMAKGPAPPAAPGTAAKGVMLDASIEPGPILFGRMQILIRKGTKTSAYPEVGSLLLDGMVHCTATLVAAHSALTAAHCVAGYEKQIAEGRFKFAAGPIATASQNMSIVTSADYPKDPASGFFYSKMQGYRDDIALVYLGGAASTRTASIHQGTPDWSTLKSQDFLFVGYGYNGDDLASAGFKREATWRVDTVQPRKIAWASANGPSTCQYDSGGPAFIKGTLTVAGVTSMGSPDCSEGIDTRVDAFSSWLAGKLR